MSSVSELFSKINGVGSSTFVFKEDERIEFFFELNIEALFDTGVKNTIVVTLKFVGEVLDYLHLPYNGAKDHSAIIEKFMEEDLPGHLEKIKAFAEHSGFVELCPKLGQIPAAFCALCPGENVFGIHLVVAPMNCYAHFLDAHWSGMATKRAQ